MALELVAGGADVRVPGGNPAGDLHDEGDRVFEHDAAEGDVLVRIDDERRARLMEAVDGINRRHGHHTGRPLPMEYDRAWEMRRRYLSGRDATRLNEILRVRAC
jgi:hypothetical protein